MKRFFQKELEQFTSDINRMGKLAIENVQLAMDALLTSNVEKAQEVVKKDDAIDDLEIKIDREGITFLSQRAPLAKDLRLVTIGMKASNDLERVGDEATSIAKRVKKLVGNNPDKEFFHLKMMGELCLEMLRDCLAAFCEKNEKEAEEKAHTLFIRDRKINQLNRKNIRDIKEKIEKDPTFSFTGIELMFVSKSLERIGDHATNIAEEIIYLLSGDDLRHTDEASRDRHRSEGSLR